MSQVSGDSNASGGVPGCWGGAADTLGWVPQKQILKQGSEIKSFIWEGKETPAEDWGGDIGRGGSPERLCHQAGEPSKCRTCLRVLPLGLRELGCVHTISHQSLREGCSQDVHVLVLSAC